VRTSAVNTIINCNFTIRPTAVKSELKLEVAAASESFADCVTAERPAKLIYGAYESMSSNRENAKNTQKC
jgi:hypothetical protein